MQFHQNRLAFLFDFWPLQITKGRFFSENSIGLKKICQKTILNFNFEITFCFSVSKLMLSEAAKLQKTRENSNDEFKIVKRHICLAMEILSYFF